MFTLSQTHEDAFRRGQRDAFIEELALASYDSLPDDAPFLNKPSRLKGAELVLRNAETNGYSTRGGLFFWLNLATIFGSHFHSDPQFEALRPPPRSLGSPQELEALNVTYAQLTAYLDKIHGGPANTYYTNAALTFADQFAAETGPGALSSLDDVAQRLAETYPQKFERHSETILQKLRSGAYGDKAQGLLASRNAADIYFVAGAEMFFGHRFETDTFKPWIGKTLERCKSKTDAGATDLHPFFTLFREWVDPD